VPTPINNLVIVSDLHCGCQMGLCSPEGARFDENGRYQPNAIQQKVWTYWREFWDAWVPTVTRGEPFAVVVNGDAIDGSHHNSTHQWSHNPEDQSQLAYDILLPIVEAAKGQYFHIRGTEAHSGVSGVEEEKLAKRLGAIPDDQGHYARYELWARVGKALTHTMHHIGTTSSSAHEASAVNAELTAEFVEAARWGEEPPDYVTRSHRHRSIVVELDTAKGYAAGIVTPGWQAKTPYTYKIAGARLSPPQFGGIVIRQGDEEHYCRRKVWSMKRSREVELWQGT
jgi:hypothetical protein